MKRKFKIIDYDVYLSIGERNFKVLCYDINEARYVESDGVGVMVKQLNGAMYSAGKHEDLIKEAQQYAMMNQPKIVKVIFLPGSNEYLINLKPRVYFDFDNGKTRSRIITFLVENTLVPDMQTRMELKWLSDRFGDPPEPPNEETITVRLPVSQVRVMIKSADVTLTESDIERIIKNRD